MTTMTARTAAHPEADKLPLAALLALAMTGFLALLTRPCPPACCCASARAWAYRKRWRASS